MYSDYSEAFDPDCVAYMLCSLDAGISGDEIADNIELPKSSPVDEEE